MKQPDNIKCAINRAASLSANIKQVTTIFANFCEIENLQTQTTIHSFVQKQNDNETIHYIFNTLKPDIELYDLSSAQ